MSRLSKFVRAAAVATPLAFATSGGAEAANVVDTVTAAGSFSTLASAIQAAGLSETLSGQGPITVFAPTDEAFAKMPAGTLDRLLLPENRDTLRTLLTYHVVPGTVAAEDIMNKVGELPTVQGDALLYNGLTNSELKVARPSAGTLVNEASIVQADIAADNGLVHAIDAVLIPEELLWPLFVGKGSPSVGFVQ